MFRASSRSRLRMISLNCECALTEGESASTFNEHRGRPPIVRSTPYIIHRARVLTASRSPGGYLDPSEDDVGGISRLLEEFLGTGTKQWRSDQPNWTVRSLLAEWYRPNFDGFFVSDIAMHHALNKSTPTNPRTCRCPRNVARSSSSRWLPSVSSGVPRQDRRIPDQCLQRCSVFRST